jgi:hypothetical protein
MEDKRREAVDEAVTTTNFLDKLYEISMDKPDVWNVMKKQEYSTARNDQGKTASQ